MDPRGVATPPRAEVVGLAATLDRGGDVRRAIRAAVLRPQVVEARVDELFARLLDRAADPSGRSFWTGRVSSGRLTYENLVVNLAISNESWNRAGATPEGYVEWTFGHLLGRSPDPSGRAFWTARLRAGTSRDRFVRSFLRSPERSRSIVRAGFARYLARNVDPGGLTHWTNRYATAKVGETDLAVELLASSESRNAGCGYDPKFCLLPFPSSRQTVRDATTATGERVALKPEWLPTNDKGTHVDPTEWNRNDGFSVGQALVVRVPGIDLAQTGLAGIDDIGASLAEDAPIVIWDVEADARVPYWVELDAHAPAGSDDQLLYVRPAVNYTPGHTYLVGMAGMTDSTGNVLGAPARFAAERKAIADGGPFLDAQDVVETTFRYQVLKTRAAMATEDLYLAWQFTVASTSNTTGRMLHIRDDALATLGVDGAPTFTVAKVTANPRAGVGTRVEGTFEVPQYLTGDGQPGARFQTGADGLPVRNGTYTAGFDCEIPASASAANPSRATVYGHGLFGSLGEVRSGPQAAMVANHNMTYCATDWIGMSDPDAIHAARVVSDVSTFASIPDRSQQGILNTIFLGRLLTSDQGFVTHPAFQAGGAPLVDTGHLFYDGNSQGGVIGGAYIAVDPNVEAGVLGVAGMNYSTLLERSVDFDLFFTIMKGSYPNRNDQVIGLGLIQMLWDRGETNGYAAHLNAERNLPGTVAKRVLIHTALGDHQVATLTAEVEARTAGIAIHQPTYLPGRTTDVAPAWGLDAIAYPSSGGGLVVWDSGAALAPLTNVPPRTGRDPHSDPRNSPKAQQQKSAFLRAGGTLVDVCGGGPCTT